MGEVNETRIDVNDYLGDVLDGVRWNGNNEDKRNFPKAFTEVLRTCNLTGRSKLIIRERFLNLYNNYYYKFKKTNFLHKSSRIIISVGSIIIPALITLDNEVGNRSRTSQIIYYTTFSISLLVTLTNALTELMQISKKYYTYATVKENLRTEGWLFLSLAGKYKHFTDHSECWRRFVNKVEKVNAQAATSELILSIHKPDDGYDTKTAENQIGLEMSDLGENNIIFAKH